MRALAVLETTFEATRGKARLLDLLPVLDGAETLQPMREIQRIVHGVSGVVDLVVHIDARPDFGRTQPRLMHGDRLGWRYCWSHELLSVRSDVELQRIGTALRGALQVRAGETYPCRRAVRPTTQISASNSRAAMSPGTCATHRRCTRLNWIRGLRSRSCNTLRRTASAGGAYIAALMLLALNRLLDGLDGAVARATHRSAFGGYLDIVADYVFYAGVPLGFALAAPPENAVAAALLASFLLTCSSFLAYAALAANEGVALEPVRQKAFFYSRGLMKATETIAFFIAMILWPSRFAVLAWIFAGLCVVTALQRSAIAARQFGKS